MKKIAITGGTGLIGKKLINALKYRDYYIINFTRDIEKSKITLPNADEHIQWNINKTDWYDKISGSYAIFNLAGASVAGGRWTEKYKKLIYDSRINGTKALVKAIENAENKPKVLINSSAVGYYGNRFNEDITEKSSKGIGFLSDVCNDWESEATASSAGRVVLARTGVVLDKNEGALAKMLLPFKMFAGGPLGSGKQYMPWIHIDDLIEMFIFVMENENIFGAVNFTSPNPVIMDEFAKTLGQVLGRPSFFRVPEFALNLLLGEQAEIVTEGQKALPKVSIGNGFDFKYKNLENAVKDLLKK
jgi:hypothetical protein